MAITTRAELTAALAARRFVPFAKTAASAGPYAGIARYGSSWTNGSVPPAGAVPAAGAAPTTCDRATLGALAVPPVAAGKTLYLCGVTLDAAPYDSQDPQALIVLDRLAHSGLYSSNVTTAQTFGGASVTLPARATDKNQVMIFVEQLAGGSPTTTTSAVTVTYTNQAGTANRTATLLGGFQNFNGIGYMWGPLDLQSGDTGVTSAESIQFGTASGLVAPGFSVVLARLVAVVASPNPTFAPPEKQGWAETGLVDVGASPCLMLATTQTSGSDVLRGAFEFCVG